MGVVSLAEARVDVEWLRFTTASWLGFWDGTAVSITAAGGGSGGSSGGCSEVRHRPGGEGGVVLLAKGLGEEWRGGASIVVKTLSSWQGTGRGIWGSGSCGSSAGRAEARRAPGGERYALPK